MRRSMRTRIFRAIWTLSLTVLCISMVISLYAMYDQLTGEQFEQLRNETELAAQGVAQSGLAYLRGLETRNIHVTWITADGKVLFDSEADLTGMENHLEREEIRMALDSGHGESTRYSTTFGEKQLYTAERLQDGTILRLSVTQSSIRHLMLRAALPVPGIALITMLVSRAVASRIAVLIVKPVNRLDLSDPMNSAGQDIYEELLPLVEHLEEQRRQIVRGSDELEKTSLIRQEFTANASHELKTPLHAISGYAELLESGMVPEEDARIFASKIRRESQRMSKLVEDIIDLSSLDSGALGMKWEKVDLNRIALNAVDSLEQTAEDAGVVLSYRGEPAVINGIAQVIYSIVYNLCLNGVKYTNRGGTVLVEVRTCRYGEMRAPAGLEQKDTADFAERMTVPGGPDFSQGQAVAVLTVRDSGIGISAEDLGRIFERFYRVDKSRSKEVGGTGLGLSIVKHAAMIHKAEIRVGSQPGRGSGFAVVFPAG